MRHLRVLFFSALLLAVVAAPANAEATEPGNSGAGSSSGPIAEAALSAVTAAAARTRIKGWSRSPVTVGYGTVVKDKFTVKPGSRSTKRKRLKLRIQYREVGTTSWKTYTKGKTNKKGSYKAKLRPDDGTWDFRVLVPRQRGVKKAKSASKRVMVTYTKWAKVSAGHAHTCALTEAGKAYCWGHNSRGQLGIGSTATSMTRPTKVEDSGALAGKRLIDISAGGSASRSHTCATASDGQLYCWGDNNFRQLGNGTTTLSRVPVRTDRGLLAGQTFTSVSAGGQHTCALTSSAAVYCWGAGGNGQLGNGATPLSSDPVAVSTPLRFRNVSAGLGQTCGITTTSQNHCWGAGTSGQLGNNALLNQALPVRTADTLPWSLVSSGGLFQCGIAAGKAYCAGAGDSGRLGDGTTSATSRPGPVDSTGVLNGKTLTQLDSAASGGFTCAIDAQNKVYCWGRGTGGQLGNGTTSSSTVPVAMRLTNVRSGTIKQVSAGENHSCAVSPDGRLYCTGFNVWGQLGTGDTRSIWIPIRVR